MNNTGNIKDPKLHVIIGPSAAGKSTAIDFLIMSGQFELIRKGTTRAARSDDSDVIHFEPRSIPAEYDLGYALYNQLYCIKSRDVEEAFQKNKHAVVIYNSFIGIDDLKAKFGDHVVTTYIHRPLTRELISTIQQERKVGINGSSLEENVEKRYLAARLLYGEYGSHSHHVDGVLLNCGDLGQYIVQIGNLFTEEYRRKRITSADSHLFMISGASDSGKRELMQYFNHFGGDGTAVAKKQTTRPSRSDDGRELESVPVLDKCYDLRYGQHGWEYGINTSQIRTDLDAGKYVFLVLSNDEAIEKIKKQFPIKSSTIYLTKDVDANDLRKILANKNMDSEEIISRVSKQTNLYNAYCQNPGQYDGVFINSFGINDEIINHAKQLMNVMRGNTRGY